MFALAYNPNGKLLVSASKHGNIHIWDNNQFTTLKLLHDFDPKQVSAELKLLWKIRFNEENFQFIPNHNQDIQSPLLLNFPKKNESKMDQLVRFLEARCAYKDKVKAKNCTTKNHPKEIKNEK